MTSTLRSLPSAALLAVALLSGTTPLFADGPRARVDEVRTISFDDDIYHGWPTLAQDAHGRLLLAWSGGRHHHVCPFGRVDYMTSDDGGQSWTYPRTLHDGPIDDRDAGVTVTADGSILVTTFTSLAYVPQLKRMQADSESTERQTAWTAAHDRLQEGEHEAMLGTWMLRSTDGGKTFSAAYRVPLNSPHGPITLADGRLLYAGKALWEEGAIVGISFSDDDGVSWSEPMALPVRKGDQTKDYHELHAVEAADGTLVVHIRNHNPENNREVLQTESKDGGKTWTTPHPIGVWGLPSHLLQLRDGRLLLTYGHRRAPLGIQARISDDHGTTWSDAMILTDDAASGDLGYPSTVERPDGTLVTVWYELLAGNAAAQLRQARWQIEP